MAGIAIVPVPAEQTFTNVNAHPESHAERAPAVVMATPGRTPEVENNQQNETYRDPEDPQADHPATLQTEWPADRTPGVRARFVRVFRGFEAQWNGSARNSRMRYPPRFKALGAIVLGLSLTWVGNYLFAVLPTIEEHSNSPCKYNDNQLTYNAKMLFVYFAWFSVARLSLFIPCIAARVAQVQSRTHGFCRTYLVHLILRDGPLYIFVVGSLLFWFHLMQSPTCEQRSPELYRTLKLYAIYSCLVSIFCLILAYWHNKLLVDATREVYEREDPSAPADTITKLQTISYDPSLFGDEDGKLYPEECAICLLAWEPEDAIKVTPCAHAFHEECIGNWLKSARTCALCRQDLTKNPVVQNPTSRPNAQVVGTPAESPDGASAAADNVPAENDLVVHIDAREQGNTPRNNQADSFHENVGTTELSTVPAGSAPGVQAEGTRVVDQQVEDTQAGAFTPRTPNTGA